ncbi:PaaI family thioesterase [Desulfovibrio ferrophilus]|uniref:Phenylacetic acid degradation-related protein n=1 Tax=Desulfovibrio ferrophilus TaxID=241368 RepID=A0A2Z6AWV7_9BACT|nr:hotdog fold thioesterase [Desulfovibrio ferrophilus]BBD07737.1 phenylacetic acid degradation-related protein [Desulfovibrio ferrophilus]
MTDYDAFKDLIENQIPYNKYVGMKLLALEPGMCKLCIPYSDNLVGDARRKAIHGGVISTLVDTCGGFTVWAASGIADRISTIDLRVDYLKPAIGCDLVAEGHIKLHGNRVGNAHVQVYAKGEPQSVLAEGRAVYNIRKARKH